MPWADPAVIVLTVTLVVPPILCLNALLVLWTLKQAKALLTVVAPAVMEPAETPAPTGSFLPTDETQAELEQQLRIAARTRDLVTVAPRRFSPLDKDSERDGGRSRTRHFGTRWQP